jgi:hypothetical protein
MWTLLGGASRPPKCDLERKRAHYVTFADAAGRLSGAIAERFAEVFRRSTGQAPRDYRRKFGSPVQQHSPEQRDGSL